MEALSKYTLLQMLRRTVANYPRHNALSMIDEEPINYEELNQRVIALQVFLHQQGVIKGDRVAILSENCPNWGIAYLAITTMGAVVVPILTDFHANEINHILRHSGAKIVFISSSLYEVIAYEDFEVRPLIVQIESFLPIPADANKDKLKELVKEGNATLSRLKGIAMKAVGLVPAEVQEDDIAAIIYTSGTTGSSKGVMLTHKNLVFDAWITLGIQKVDQYDKLISILPLAHTYECTIGFIIPIMQGACVWYLDKPPTARVLVPAMQKIHPTMILSVPLVIEKIFKLQVHPQLTKNALMKELYKVPPIRKALHKVAGKKLMKTFGGALHFFGIGGAMLSAEVERFLYEAGFPYAIGYGLTETSPLIAGCSPSVVKFRSTGTVLKGIEVRIADPDRITGEGEIQVKGDTVMKGYYRDKARTDEAFTPDGWFKTGDLGVLTKQNYLYIKGRLKNVIVGASGENIYPEELEAKINENELVLESLVYELEGKICAKVFLNYEIIDKLYGISKMSSVSAEKHIKSLLEDIRKKVNQNVASFSVIHRIAEQKEPFEKTPTKKIKRFLYQN